MTPTFQRNSLTPSSGWWDAEVDAEAILSDNHFYVHLDIILPPWKWRPHVPSKCRCQTAVLRSVKTQKTVCYVRYVTDCQQNELQLW